MAIVKLKDVKKTETIVISGWHEGEELEVEVRRPNLYQMAASGTVPNPLLAEIEKLYTAAIKEGNDRDREKEGAALLTIARNALVSPTMDEIEAEGLQVTDVQALEIYSWVLRGAKGLASFRGRKS